MLRPGNVIIVSGTAPIFGVHQSLGHRHWKPEQERRMLTAILQTHTQKEFHSALGHFQKHIGASVKEKVPKKVRAPPEIP